MPRTSFDRLLSWVGVVLTVALLGAGVGLLIGSNFDTNAVRAQLVQQKVFFPAVGSSDYHDLVAVHQTDLAGKQVLTGAQAQIFANDVIGADTLAISGGKTYSQLSAASLADPSNVALANQVALVFRGDTLRGLLLNAYAFGTLGTLALYGSIACFALGVIMLILTLLGLRHAKNADPDEQVLV